LAVTNEEDLEARSGIGYLIEREKGNTTTTIETVETEVDTRKNITADGKTEPKIVLASLRQTVTKRARVILRHGCGTGLSR